MRYEIIFHIAMAFIAFAFTRIWQHWIDKPDEYEKLHKERIGRLSGRLGRPRRKGKDKKKEESQK
jgi:hypothetical protein